MKSRTKTKSSDNLHSFQPFNKDVKENTGYRYTTQASYSSIVANQRITDAVLELIPKDTKTIIDVGCGDGIYTAQLAEKRKDIKFSAFDLAEKAIALAKKKYPKIDFFVEDAMNISPKQKNKYELSIVRGVVHHLPDAEKGIEQMGELAKTMIIVEPNGNNPILKYIEKHSSYHIEHHEQSFTDKQLRSWVEKLGFTVKALKYVGFVPFFFPEVPARMIHFFQPVLEMIPFLGKYFGAQIVMVAEKEKLN